MSVGAHIDTQGFRVFYGPPDMPREPYDLDPDTQGGVCSHFYRKLVCNTSQRHWADDQPYIKDKHPKKCLGTSCSCPKEAPNIPRLRTAYIRPYVAGQGESVLARAKEFGPHFLCVPAMDCAKCQARYKKERDARATKREGRGGGGGGGSAGKKRKGGSDSNPEKKSKEPRTKTDDGSGRMRYDPIRS